MADEGGQRSFGSSSFDFDVVFRDDISEILAKVDSKLASDVVDEMVDVYDMSTLLDIRLKMFGYAKKKLLVNVKRTVTRIWIRSSVVRSPPVPMTTPRLWWTNGR